MYYTILHDSFKSTIKHIQKIEKKFKLRNSNYSNNKDSRKYMRSVYNKIIIWEASVTEKLPKLKIDTLIS